ncbi:TonB-dependent receptor [Anabaena sp. UHCC 0399]|uniref:TonB-dependent receptor plug domain-containing protein n=1 Tax=Anabaena sp. UHCC 0399 TaxID=3110238 RepID=UPI002B21A1DC|nr:TonB-dependent receptor [Anabaena sp. UHCC 0399]MEA5568394.1 TonB-dependent receptor [Anabaena sp. UHCC 0399]
MRQKLWMLPLSLLGAFVGSPSLASEIAVEESDINQKYQNFNPDILQVSEVIQHSTDAILLMQPSELQVVKSEKLAQAEVPLEDDADISLEAIGEQDSLPQSTPTYIIEKEEIQKQGATSVADVLKRMPGFAINDVGHGADIHTGTYYRGHSINQSVFLINGRPINNDVNTYHGATDLNSIPVEAIERIEVSSGASTALYGSSAFGGVINIITKQGSSTPKFNATVEFGSLNLNNQQTSFSSGGKNFRYNLSFERFFIDNRYKVPQGAANRDASGNLFNADTATSTYFGNFAVDLNPKNTLSFDVKKLSSRRGLIYFGFPLQRDRLDHDGLNIGLSWRSQLAKDSNLTTTLGYNQDYFNTYGPTVFQGNTFYRTGTLDTQNLTARVDHEWRLTNNNRLRWGLDLKNTNLDGITNSTSPNRIALNEEENRSVLNTALFAVNTWDLSDTFQVDLGLRQSFDSQFGNYLNPSVGLRYAMSPNLAVRGSWAGGQRNPGLDQLYLYDTVHGWLSNPDLKPETGSSWTAGLDVKFSQDLTGQFTYFGSSLDNRLGIIQGQWQNIGLVDTNGLEAALRWRFTRNWSTFVNYTYTDAQIKTGTERGLQLGLIPYSNLQAGIGYQQNGWQANLYATYNSGARRALFNNPNDKNTDFAPSYVNFDLSGRIPLSKGLGLTFYLENLLGEQYERVNRIYSPGFTFRVGLSSSI